MSSLCFLLFTKTLYAVSDYGARRFGQLCSRNDKEKISDFKKTDHGKQMSQKETYINVKHLL